MSNVSAAAPITTTGFEDTAYYVPLASTAATYYVGQFIGINSSGYGFNLDDTAAGQFAGVSLEKLTVASGGSNGDSQLRVDRPRLIEIDIASAAITDTGRPVYV